MTGIRCLFLFRPFLLYFTTLKYIPPMPSGVTLKTPSFFLGIPVNPLFVRSVSPPLYVVGTSPIPVSLQLFIVPPVTPVSSLLFPSQDSLFHSPLSPWSSVPQINNQVRT